MQKNFWYVEGVGGVGGVWTKTVFRSELFDTEAEAVKYEKENRLRILRAGADWIFIRRHKDSVADVYREYVLFLYNLDPWLICEAFDDEDEQEFAARVSVNMDIDSVEYDIEQTRELIDGDPDNMKVLDGFARRIQALKRA